MFSVCVLSPEDMAEFVNTIGTRVVRGRDWKWSNQDGGSIGTVIGVDWNKNGWTRIIWDHSMDTDGTTHTYRMGADSKYDLTLAKCIIGKNLTSNTNSTFYMLV